MSTIPRLCTRIPEFPHPQTSRLLTLAMALKKPQAAGLRSVKLLRFTFIPSECTHEEKNKTKHVFLFLRKQLWTLWSSKSTQYLEIFSAVVLLRDSAVLAHSWRLSLCACLSFALKAYFVSCNCSIISLASFISAASWLYFSTSSWFSLRSSTTSWLSSSLCFPQCSFSCSISDSVSSICFTRLSSLSLDISQVCKFHSIALFPLSVCLLSCLEWLLRSWLVWDSRYSGH